MVSRSPPPDAAMKRFVIAGLFLVLGFIILGVATSYVMSGPDKPAQRPHPAPASADTTPKGHANPGTAQQPITEQLQSQNKPGQFGMTAMPGGLGDISSGTIGSAGNLTTVPGNIVPLSTSVPPPTIRPTPDADGMPHVPVLPQTDESTMRGK
jgi:hypothetical protein